jgi:hypothetical protein
VAFYRYGQFQSLVTWNGQWLFTSEIRDRNDDINKIGLVVQGDQFTVYINDVKMRNPHSHKKLTEGQIALLAHQESGKTTCTFSDTFLWILK